MKTQYVHFRLIACYFLFPWRNHAEIRRRSFLFHNSRQYLLHQTCVIRLFSMRVDWSEIKASAKLCKCTNCFFLCTADNSMQVDFDIWCKQLILIIHYQQQYLSYIENLKSDKILSWIKSNFNPRCIHQYTLMLFYRDHYYFT